MKDKIRLLTLILIVIYFQIDSAFCSDWPRWRGPEANGISREEGWNPGALIPAPKILWEVNAGQGWSSVVVKDGYVYTMGNRKGKDIIYCLESESGKEVWKRSYDCDGGNWPGPRATPVIDGNHVYTFSRNGDLLCLDRKTGGLIWYVNVMADFQAQNIEWGFTSSPVIDGDILFVNACAHGIALNKNTGEKIWASSSGKCGYASPVVYQMGNRKYVAIFSEKSLFGVDLETGEKKWSYYWETDYDINAADPIFVENKLFISSGYRCGCALLDISGKKPKTVWRNREISNHFGSSILIDGYIYGPSGNTGERSSSLNCISLETGDLIWSQNLGFNSIMASDGKLISLNEQGELIICLAQKEGYEELARASVLSADRSKVCWTAPVLSNGMIFCRNSVGDLVCVDVR